MGVSLGLYSPRAETQPSREETQPSPVQRVCLGQREVALLRSSVKELEDEKGNSSPQVGTRRVSVKDAGASPAVATRFFSGAPALTPELQKIVTEINATSPSKSEYTKATTTLGQLKKNDLDTIAPFLTHVDLRDSRFKEWSPDKLKEFIGKCSLLKALLINSPKIKDLPDLLKCEWLDCSGSHELSKIGTIPSCKKFISNHCYALKELPVLSLCEELDVGACKGLKIIRDIPKVRELNVGGCSSLTEISGELLHCKDFRGDWTALEILPETLPVCENFRALGAYFKKLPRLPLAEIVNCSGSKVKEISGLDSCKSLKCEGCRYLEAVYLLPCCRNANFDGCESLKKRIELPQGGRVSCYGCHKLSGMPQLAPGGKIESDIMFIECSSLLKAPLEVLEQLRRGFLRATLFPRMMFTDKEGYAYIPPNEEPKSYLFKTFLDALYSSSADKNESMQLSSEHLSASKRMFESGVAKRMLEFVCSDQIQIEDRHLKLLQSLERGDTEFTNQTKVLEVTVERGTPVQPVLGRVVGQTAKEL